MLRKIILLFVLAASPALAGPAVVESVSVQSTGGGYTFDVTVLHEDKGWDDYVDAWRITDASGTVFGERKLAHPHVNEQPFTRSLSGVKIPGDVTSVRVQVHDTVTGWAPDSKVVTLP